MAEIKPFGAMRFTQSAGDISKLCCPPYDIISEQEKQALLEKNQHNIIRLELPEKTEEGYALAGDTLKKWLDSGILETDSTEAIYAYEEEFDALGEHYSFRGIVCRVKLYEFSENVVLPHEETLSKAKADRFNLMTATGCNFSQIYSLYRDEKGETAKTVAAATNAPAHTEFTDGEGVTHRLWSITDRSVISKFVSQFADRKLYIADGHHRYETALRYRKSVNSAGESDYVMMFLIDMENSGLVVFPTHRIVKGLENYNTGKILSRIEENFTVSKLNAKEEIRPLLDKAYKNGEKAFGMYDGNASYLLTLNSMDAVEKLLPTASDALRGLDVSVLHSLLLEGILNIDRENMANGINLRYTRSEAEAFSAAEGDANVCFILNPTRVSEIAAVSQEGEKMPQKSTYFYPKLITGLVMNKIL